MSREITVSRPIGRGIMRAEEVAFQRETADKLCEYAIKRDECRYYELEAIRMIERGSLTGTDYDWAASAAQWRDLGDFWHRQARVAADCLR